MYRHSGTWTERDGAIIEVGLFVGEWRAFEDIPRFQAMIDTGAEETCISRTAAALLGIRDEPISIRRVSTPGGAAELNVYEVNLVFFLDPSYLQMREQEVVETKSDADQWDVLLGRDILKDAIFFMDFSGRFTLAYA